MESINKEAGAAQGNANVGVNTVTEAATHGAKKPRRGASERVKDLLEASRAKAERVKANGGPVAIPDLVKHPWMAGAARIPGYGYFVNRDGKVYNLRYNELVKDRGMYVCLCKNGNVRKYAVAYLVAGVFLPNPRFYKYVSHKDGDPRNNKVENLEWTQGQESGRKGVMKRVVCFAKDGSVLATFESVKEAAEAGGLRSSGISRACACGGKCGGFLWRYA